MISLRNINTVAKYEIKTLLRSWFFRIFSGLVFAILTFFSVFLFTPAIETAPWMFRGLAGAIAYWNVLLLNIAQDIIAVFLASDFLKRDRKTNTTEVVYMRSMTNADYFFGKLLGLLWVFIGLNVLILLMNVIISAAFSDIPFQFMPFVWYFVLVSIPTLMFMFGLTFFVMSLVKNQAVTFILLLGYVALSLFFLQNKVWGVFDSTAFFMPLAMSNFVGFTNLSELLMQRGAYFLMGLGFLFASILLFKRLPQSKTMQTISAVCAIVFIAVAVGLFSMYYTHFKKAQTFRADVRAINDKYLADDIFNIRQHDIDFNHQGDMYQAVSKMLLVNENDQPLEKAIFSLNPGLKVESVAIQGKNVSFEKELHLLRFDTPTVQPGDSIAVDITFGGTLDDRICYADIPDDNHAKEPGLFLYRIPRAYYFLQPHYVLLTHEILWYPIAGTTYGSSITAKPHKQFTDYTLTVTTPSDLTVLSQGLMQENNGTIQFKPEHPVPQISLVMGVYEKRSVEVENVEYSLYFHPEHAFFIEPVEGLGDSLNVLIREEKDDHEATLGLRYPFSRFSLIETPVQFIGFTRPLSFTSENAQPEQVLVNERGVIMTSADFAWTIRRSGDRMRDRNMEQSESEQKFRALQRFIRGELFATEPGRGFGDQRMIPDDMFSIFSNYYEFLNNIDYQENNMLNAAMEAYLKNKLSNGGFNFFRRFREGITAEEKANLALRDSSMMEILNNTQDVETANAILTNKSIQLFKYIESQVDKEELNTFLIDMLQKYRYRTLQSTDFVTAIREKFEIDVDNQLKQWGEQKGVPSFLFADFDNYEIIDNNRSKYQVKFKIYNNSEIDGLVTIDFMLRGQRGFGPPGGRSGDTATDYEKVVFIPAGKTLEYANVLDEQPRGISLNTMISENLPVSNVHNFEEFEKGPKIKPQVGTSIIDEPPVLTLPGEYIVDNESDGFQVHNVAEQSGLRRLLKLSEEREEYQPFNPWGGPSVWSKTVNDQFYGDIIKSAHFIRSGDGSKKVSWTADLAQSGKYDVYVFTPQSQFGQRGRRGGDFFKEKHVTIYHDDGEENVELDSENSGWIFVGEFYFSQGPAKIEMTDQSSGRIVVADAVKWVKK